MPTEDRVQESLQTIDISSMTREEKRATEREALAQEAGAREGEVSSVFYERSARRTSREALVEIQAEVDRMGAVAPEAPSEPTFRETRALRHFLGRTWSKASVVDRRGQGALMEVFDEPARGGKRMLLSVRGEEVRFVEGPGDAGPAPADIQARVDAMMAEREGRGAAPAVPGPALPASAAAPEPGAADPAAPAAPSAPRAVPPAGPATDEERSTAGSGMQEPKPKKSFMGRLPFGSRGKKPDTESGPAPDPAAARAPEAAPSTPPDSAPPSADAPEKGGKGLRSKLPFRRRS
ncbi:MAG: hypothetical protein ACYDDF_01460 [Thermoplasmatota archaeon]